MQTSFGHMDTHDHLQVRYGKWATSRDTCRGAIVVLGGRTEFMEKYSETIGELRDRGFDVVSLDWRGQGLSKRQLGDRLKGFVATYEDYLLDLHRLMEQHVLRKDYPHLSVLGHSMGGHIALRYLRDHPDVFQSAVLVSPMFDILFPSSINKTVRWVTWVAVLAGMGQRYAVGTHRYRSSDEKFQGNRLTSDPRRFRFAHRAIARNPDLAVGGVTYRWLAATFRSIDLLHAAGFPETIATPSHIVCGEQDEVVSIEAQYEICRRMKDCQLTMIPGARHEILMECDPIRNTFWGLFDKHMDRWAVS